MIATSSSGKPKLTSMPTIGIRIIEPCIEISRGQGGQHYRASRGGGQCRRVGNIPWMRVLASMDSPRRRQPKLGSKRRILVVPPRRIVMKPLFAISALALVLAGCASQEYTQVAQADCKVYPITTTSVTGNKPEVSSIRQRAAEADLATSSYRFRNLGRNGPPGHNTAAILRASN